MAIHGVKLNERSNETHVVSALLLICCQLEKGDNVAHLYGGEASTIAPWQFIGNMPERLAKILSQIARRGLCFHIAPHGENFGVFIAKNQKAIDEICR